MGSTAALGCRDEEAAIRSKARESAWIPANGTFARHPAASSRGGDHPTLSAMRPAPAAWDRSMDLPVLTLYGIAAFASFAHRLFAHEPPGTRAAFRAEGEAWR